MFELEKILGRHYFTIGIGDVFLSPPTHPLLSDYLKDGCSDSFVSWEVIGAIKTVPVDFCVREIFQKNRGIPGISNDQMKTLRIADIRTGDAIIRQNLDVMTSDDKDLPTNKTGDKQCEDEPNKQEQKTDVGDAEDTQDRLPLEVIRSSFQRIFQDISEGAKANSEATIKSLQALQGTALSRIKALATKEEDPDLTSQDVWIPPFPQSADENNNSSEERGQLHRSLKIEFPLLKSERAVTKQIGSDEEDHWIKVTADKPFDDIIPFLYNPEEDLHSLYLFRNKGFEGTMASKSNQRKGGQTSQKRDLHRDGRNLLGWNDGIETILRLRPEISKDERRSVHRLVGEKCRFFTTSTIAEFPLEREAGAHRKTEGTADERIPMAGVIVVQWTKQALEKGSRKRKRPGNQQEGHDDKYPHILCVLKKRQREHLTAWQAVMAALRCRPTDLGLAGIKDMHAVTYQFCTIRNSKPGRVYGANNRLRKNGMELGTVFQVDWLLNNGDLDGNRFESVVRNL